MAKPSKRAVGILTGGGDCPGLEAVIRAATRTALSREWEIYGSEDGWEGLLRKKLRRLTRADVRGIVARGGAILGTNGLSPFEYPVHRGRRTVEVDRSQELVRNFHALGLAGLIVIGGDGTLAMAERFHRRGVPIVAVPKAVENDLPGTAASFGFDTAVATATAALQKLHPSAEAHQRVMVVEVMGRNAGFIALHAGMAGGADVILIPEIPFRVDSVLDSIRARERAGREFTIIVVASGAAPETSGGSRASKEAEGARKTSIGEWLTQELAKRQKRETRFLALADLQRGGAPSGFDRLLATRYGAGAMRLVDEGLFGNMVCFKPPAIAAIPLHQVVGRLARVSVESDLVQSARDLGLGFGD
jgi:6-phosphofructokinase 1